VARKIVPSRGEAKRLIRQGGLDLDGVRINDLAAKLSLKEKKDHVLRVGKRKFYKIRITG
jgi:tyrosyl-tRNA synthetase